MGHITRLCDIWTPIREKAAEQVPGFRTAIVEKPPRILHEFVASNDTGEVMVDVYGYGSIGPAQVDYLSDMVRGIAANRPPTDNGPKWANMIVIPNQTRKGVLIPTDYAVVGTANVIGDRADPESAWRLGRVLRQALDMPYTHSTDLNMPTAVDVTRSPYSEELWGIPTPTGVSIEPVKFY